MLHEERRALNLLLNLNLKNTKKYITLEQHNVKKYYSIKKIIQFYYRMKITAVSIMNST